MVRNLPYVLFKKNVRLLCAALWATFVRRLFLFVRYFVRVFVCFVSELCAVVCKRSFAILSDGDAFRGTPNQLAHRVVRTLCEPSRFNRCSIREPPKPSKNKELRAKSERIRTKKQNNYNNDNHGKTCSA